MVQLFISPEIFTMQNFWWCHSRINIIRNILIWRVSKSSLLSREPLSISLKIKEVKKKYIYTCIICILKFVHQDVKNGKMWKFAILLLPQKLGQDIQSCPWKAIIYVMKILRSQPSKGTTHTEALPPILSMVKRCFSSIPYPKNATAVGSLSLCLDDQPTMCFYLYTIYQNRPRDKSNICRWPLII